MEAEQSAIESQPLVFGLTLLQQSTLGEHYVFTVWLRRFGYALDTGESSGSPERLTSSCRISSAIDVDPGKGYGVNESLQQARLGRGLDQETHQTHARADHPQALARGAFAKQRTAEQLIAHG